MKKGNTNSFRCEIEKSNRFQFSIFHFQLNEKWKIILLLFIFNFQLSIFNSTAQVVSFPVHVTVQVLPPYGLYLTDYYSGTRDRLIVTLLNRDAQQSTLQVKLRVTIRNGSSFSLQSRDELYYPMITLESGVPFRLTNADIVPYLAPDRITMNGYLQNGKLPTGMTEFSVQALDYTTGRPLSTVATGRAWLELKPPPQLNLPEKNEQVALRDPQYIRFQWMPRHQGVASTIYEFTLKELPANGAAPQSAFLYGNPIYQTQTQFTTINYTHLEPLLMPGKLYGWQVQAIAMDGIDEVGLFDNNGFSEVGWFYINGSTPSPLNVTAEAGYRKMTIDWQTAPATGGASALTGQNAYVVEYRPKSESDIFDWTSTQTSANTLTAYDLTAGLTYEYRVGTLGTTLDPVFSPVGEVTLPADDAERLARCGMVPVVDVSNQNPKENLAPGEVVVIGGDFPMTVTKAASQGSGWYSGEGYITFPWIFETKVLVQFDRLRVNTDNRQIDGAVETQYDPKASQIANTNQLDQGGKSTSPAGIVFPTVTLDFTVPEAPVGEYDPETGQLTIMDESGTPHQIDVPKNNGASAFPMTITDAAGNKYQIDLPEEAKTPAESEEGGNETTAPVITQIKDENTNLDEVVIQGLSDNYEVVINGENKTANANDIKKGVKLVYSGQKIEMKLQKNNGDTINKANILWQITPKGQKMQETSDILTQNFTMSDRDVTVAIYEKTIVKGKDSKAIVATITFVVSQSPYITLSTQSNYDGEFGFDDGEDFRDNQAPKLNKQYGIIQVADNNNKTRTLYVPWMTLLQGQPSARLQVKLSKEIEGDNIYVETTSESITADYDQQLKQLTVTNNGLDNDFDNPVYINFYRDDKYKLQTKMLIGQCAVVGKQQFKPINVQIIYLAPDPAKFENAIDKTRLQTLLNSNSMNQAFATFNVLPDIIQIKSDLSNSSSTMEAYRAIYGICASKGMIFTNHIRPTTIYVVITDLEFKAGGDDAFYGGGVVDNFNLVAMWSMKNTKEDEEKAIIHEIGHTLELKDVFKDAALGNPLVKFSRNNYMDYYIPRKMFFKTQIQTLINNLK